LLETKTGKAPTFLSSRAAGMESALHGIGNAFMVAGGALFCAALEIIFPILSDWK
jgi:hypothetical protein